MNLMLTVLFPAILKSAPFLVISQNLSTNQQQEHSLMTLFCQAMVQSSWNVTLSPVSIISYYTLLVGHFFSLTGNILGKKFQPVKY